MCHVPTNEQTFVREVFVEAREVVWSWLATIGGGARGVGGGATSTPIFSQFGRSTCIMSYEGKIPEGLLCLYR